ncbi:MAG: hypothetical protein GTN98_11375 [Woeseiaceae bacterium]|nr:hypothetical protein [Woeseiaceae bacterium]
MKKFPCIAAALLVAGASQAHHGSSTHFDHSQSVELSGTITEIRWVNPHSYVHLDVAGNDGSVASWRCEMRAAAVLKRSGWTESMFRPGSRIDIEGIPARHEERTCYVRSLSIDGGAAISRYEQLDEAEDEFDAGDRSLVLSNGRPNISGNWAAPQRLLQEDERRRRSKAGFRGAAYEQSDLGKAAVANFDVNKDNPRYHCQAVNIIADWIFGQHVNHIEQIDDTIIVSYGFMDIVRTIRLDIDEHPEDMRPSRAGHSIGRWEDGVLVVDTIGFAPGYLDGRIGIMHSDQLHVVERFTFDPAMQSLMREYVIEDPLYLAEPVTNQDAVFLTETTFELYDCEDLTGEFD